MLTCQWVVAKNCQFQREAVSHPKAAQNTIVRLAATSRLPRRIKTIRATNHFAPVLLHGMANVARPQENAGDVHNLVEATIISV